MAYNSSKSSSTSSTGQWLSVDLASRLGQYEARVSVQAGRYGALPAALRRVRQGGKSAKPAALAATNKYLARSNKSRTAANATKRSGDPRL
jgi:hypothetical protein